MMKNIIEYTKCIKNKLKIKMNYYSHINILFMILTKKSKMPPKLFKNQKKEKKIISKNSKKVKLLMIHSKNIIIYSKKKMKIIKPKNINLMTEFYKSSDYPLILKEIINSKKTSPLLPKNKNIIILSQLNNYLVTLNIII